MVVISFFTSVVISVVTLLASVEKSLLADAVAKKARVERVRVARNFDFITSFLILFVFVFCPACSNMRANFAKCAEIDKKKRFLTKKIKLWVRE